MNKLNNHAELIESFVKVVAHTFEGQFTQPKQAQLRQELLKTLNPQQVPPVYKKVTILLSDLRGFTAMAEQYPAATIIQILNLYFSRMSEIIFRYGGTIDKFMGDSIMTIFGMPEARPDDLERALACAVEMQRSMFEVNSLNTELGYPRLFMGIGINTGKVVVGDLGSELHSEHTVIGKEVNLASRIEAFSLRGQILLSEHSYNLAQGFIECGKPNQVQIKGKHHPVKFYELFATRRPRHLEVPRIEARKSPRIPVDFPLRFSLLTDRYVAQDSYQGTAIDLSYHGLQAYLPIPLEAYSDLRIELSTSLMANNPNHIYAKVLRTQPEKSGWLSRMEFTTIDDMGQATIKSYIDQSIAPV